jgi:hypothetical protein
MLNISFLLCDNMLATSATLPMELLHAAVTLATANIDSELEAQPLKITLVSTSGHPIKTRTGLKLSPDCAIANSPNGRYRLPSRSVA